MLILVLNCGSSSLKVQCFDIEDNKFTKIFAAHAECLGTMDSKLNLDFPENEIVFMEQMLSHKHCLNWLLSHLKQRNITIDLVSHRIVHGGCFFNKATLVDENVFKKLASISELAPLHNPISLEGIKLISEFLPQTPQTIVCDTAFHLTIPEEQHRYGISEELYTMGVRRYGAHGTNYAYLVRKLKDLLGDSEPITGILAHLGQGASICAVINGKAQYTSMGFSPLSGCQMGSRCGNIDPMVVPYIMDKKNCTLKDTMRIFNKESGLLGLTGTNDIRQVLSAYNRKNEAAKLAIKMFVDSVAKEIGNGIVAMKQIPKNLVFSAGIGQNSAQIREELCFLLKKTLLPTIELDEKANNIGEFKISTPSSGINVYVVPANEELEIAEQSYELFSNNN